jgi:hypothetical protein
MLYSWCTGRECIEQVEIRAHESARKKSRKRRRTEGQKGEAPATANIGNKKEPGHP